MTTNSMIKGLITSLLLAMPAAHATTLDFEGFSAGTIIDNEYFASDGVTINGVNNRTGDTNLAVIFDTDNPTGGDGDLRAPFGPGDFYPGNVLIVHEHPDECNLTDCGNDPDDEGARFSNKSTATINFMFDQVIEILSIDFFDIENAENNTTELNEIRLYDGSGTQIANNSYHTPDTGGDRLWDRVIFGPGNGVGVSGIRRIEVNFAGSGALDNVTYNVVPVPAAFWLFGTALIGFIGYSRRRTV